MAGERVRDQGTLRNFRWVVPGRLAGLARPDTPAALAALRAAGVTTLISLTEDPLPPDLLAQQGLGAHHWPIADYTAPPVARATVIVADIEALLAEGQVIAVHCGAGLGRTGTLLACYLVAGGQDAAQAIVASRAGAPGSVETAAQEALVAAYARRTPAGQGG